MLKGDPGGSAFRELTVGLKKQARCTPTGNASQKAVSGTPETQQKAQWEFREENSSLKLLCVAGPGRLGKIWTGRNGDEGA